jgi:chromosome segregation ATPase
LADQRNRAAELSGEIAQLEGRLRRLEEERIRVQTQLTAMESSAESLENLARDLDETVTGAGGLEDRIESIDQQLGRVIEEAATPDGPVSIQALNQQLAQALSAAEELRSAALEDLAAAAQAYEQADRQATNARVTGAASALDRLVNQTMEGVAGSSEISRAITQRERANLFVNAAQVDAALLRLQTAATASQQAGRSIGNLNLGEPAASFSRNLERAAASLRDGLETVDVALGGARNAQQAAALGEKLRILRRMRDVRQLLASTAQGDTPAAEVTVELPSMQELETMMTEVFDTAASADISLPRTGRTAEPALPDDPASADDDQTGLTDDAASETDDAAAEMEADE